MTRTFLAVELPEPTRLAVERLQEDLRASQPGLRWTAPQLLHLTLAFLGDVPTRALDRIGDAVAEAVATIPRFLLELQGLGAFPTPTRARVLWVGLAGEALELLTDLQRSVVAATKAVGLPPADGRFHPHVTIGRSKAGRGPSPNLAAVCEQSQGWKAGPLPVETVVTMASELTPRGPIYRVVRSAPLAATSP
ncbi:RNA 2',3'-cyclic phosphodiesterase [Tautonia rosea]|uniref:RNA 2',3'-cyclic phosphodiesterase n=1 Tax=Tautonia rosea TaxID=2728037 RepID=UPI0014751E51|nr:RNA 2',3'-cyclic phosphodiesterase [Tautonia rosea]